MLKTYYHLTKPGIIYGNLLTAAAGFLLAAHGSINYGLLLATLVGTSLVIASACVFNNYLDRSIDQEMARTKNRALVQGHVSGRSALIYATVLGIFGTVILAAWTNALVVIIGLIAFVDYVILYGLSKRRSVHGTLVGSISGAAPIVAGYCAVTGRLDAAAIILFFMLALWQMPHFYAIALYRSADYAAAKIPVLPVVRGPRVAKIQIMCYIIAFMAATSLLTIYGYTGTVFLLVMLALGLGWLVLGASKLRAVSDERWGRSMFLYSLIVILGLSVMTSVGALLP